jgi:hypothetical protein
MRTEWVFHTPPPPDNAEPNPSTAQQRPVEGHDTEYISSGALLVDTGHAPPLKVKTSLFSSTATQ